MEDIVRHVVPALVLGAALVVGPSLAGAQDEKPADPTPAPTPAGTPFLAGHWKLNVQDSEDARQKMQQSMAGRDGGSGSGGGTGGGGYGHGGGGGYGGGGGGGYGHRGGGGGGGYGRGGGGYGGGGRSGGGDASGTSQQSHDPQGVRALLFSAPQDLTVTETATEIAMLDQDGFMRTLHPDGKSHKTESGEDEVTTRWESDHLVVETKGKSGTKLTETYGLDAEKVRLTVNLRAEGGSRPAISIRRVYDAQRPAGQN
jgi:hypothetical protein